MMHFFLHAHTSDLNCILVGKTRICTAAIPRQLCWWRSCMIYISRTVPKKTLWWLFSGGERRKYVVKIIEWFHKQEAKKCKRSPIHYVSLFYFVRQHDLLYCNIVSVVCAMQSVLSGVSETEQWNHPYSSKTYSSPWIPVILIIILLTLLPDLYEQNQSHTIGFGKCLLCQILNGTLGILCFISLCL